MTTSSTASTNQPVAATAASPAPLSLHHVKELRDRMSTQPVTSGNPLLHVSTAPPNSVDQVFQTALNKSHNTAGISLVGASSDIDTLFLRGTEQVKQLEALQVTPEEIFAKENCLQLINHAQKMLEEAYQHISPNMPTQAKISRLKELEALFDRLNEVHLLWYPNKGYRPALQGSLNTSGRHMQLQRYIALQGTEIFVNIFSDLSYAVQSSSLKIDTRVEIFVDIDAFLTSGEGSLSLEEKVDLFEEMLDKLTFFAKSLSQENSTIAQLIVNCQSKISELKPIASDFAEEPLFWFTEEYMHEQINSITHHLTELFKTHEERFSSIKSIPKSILVGLEHDKKRLSKIYDWIAGDLLLPVETKISILRLLRDRFNRMHELIKKWSGEDDKMASAGIMACDSGIMIFTRRQSVPTPSYTPQTSSRREPTNSSCSTAMTNIPIHQPRNVRPIKPEPGSSKIQLIFKTSLLGLLFMGISFLLYRRFICVLSAQGQNIPGHFP